LTVALAIALGALARAAAPVGPAAPLATQAHRIAQSTPVVRASPAAEAAKPAPVRVDADEVHYAFQRHEVTFVGSPAKPVTMTRDDARLTCARLVAHTDDAGQIVSAVCQGDVRLTRGPRLVTCDKATFDAPAERVVCDGNPVLKDAGSEAHGTRLVYELKTDEAKLEGAAITLPGAEVEQRRKALEERKGERR
jgi:lipopolysaccharide export system protein LptA